MEEVQQKLKDLKDRYSKIKEQIDSDVLLREIRELEAQTMKEGFWGDQKQASAISQTENCSNSRGIGDQDSECFGIF